MNKLIPFKIFESESSISKNNQEYQTLSNILQSEIFDDMDIQIITDESWEDDDSPEHKFWCYNYHSSGERLNTGSEIPQDRKIMKIFVYNISLEECLVIEQKLVDLQPIVHAMIGKQLVFTSEQINEKTWDYIIKLVE
jgi:hypothetical protein